MILKAYTAYTSYNYKHVTNKHVAESGWTCQNVWQGICKNMRHHNKQVPKNSLNNVDTGNKQKWKINKHIKIIK